MSAAAAPAIAAVLAAAAVLVWPPRPLGDGRTGGQRRAPRPTLSAAGVVAAGGAAALLVGPAAAVATLLLGSTIRRAVLAAAATRRHERRRIAAAAALASLARELRAGTDPVAALAEVGRHADPAVASLFSGVARGASPAPVVTGRVDVAARLAAGLQLTQRHGVRFAALVDALVRDVTDEITGARDRSAQVAGPRFSGWVLAGLPGFGLLLGTGMGADPLRVLLATTAGNVLLVSGVTLVCAGLLWAERLVRA